MSGRNLRSNSSAPPIFPIGNTIYDTTATTMSGTAPVPAPAAATTTTEEEWTTNPYTPAILTLKSKGPTDGSRIGDTIDQSKTLIDFIKQKASAFGPCVTHLPIEFDAAGNPTKFANIIDQYQGIPLSTVIRAAHKLYGTALSPTDPIPHATNSALWTQRDIDPKTQSALPTL
eukprot:scaffold65021_cov87-Cyclotella_meneghiniana.AAC.7